MTGQVSAFRQIIIVAVLAGAVALVWYNQENLRLALGIAADAPVERSSRTRAGVPVIVAPVEFANDALSLQVVGTGRALRSISLRSEATGKVNSIAIEPGKKFSAGEGLLTLDDTEQELAVKIAQAQLDESNRVFERGETLRTSGNTALARLQQLRTAAEVARLELERAKEALKDRVLRAPFDGISGIAEVEVGAWVDTQTDIASYDDRSLILVQFELPETFLPRVQEGMSVTATTASVPGKKFQGTVSAIDSRITASSRTTRVRVSVPNPDDRLRPGASFAIRLDVPGERFAKVPELSLQYTRGELYVWRVRDGKAEQVAISMVRRSAGTVLVDGKLSQGDQVVVEGTQRLEPGQPVEVVGEMGDRTG
ncbi:MAG: efflux RND transporter periplasmic adaptor subunit [Anderseniella sp.]